MLKFFFSILLLGNAALLVYQQGYLDALLPGGAREPGRLNNQLNADRIRQIAPAPKAKGSTSTSTSTSTNANASVTPAVADAPATPATPAAPVAPAMPAAPPAPAPATSNAPAVAAAPEAKALACVEIGNFSSREAKRFEAQLAALPFNGKMARRNVREVLSHMVYIPPQADREAAEKKAAELQGLGVTDFYIIQDNSDMRWGISLGVFRKEEAARAHLANLTQAGVRSARIGERSITATMVAFQLQGMDVATQARLDKLREEFPRQETRACEAG